MTKKDIPFNKPLHIEKSLEYVRQVLTSGDGIGDGYFSKQCQGLLAQELGVPEVLLTASGTHALELAALLLNIQPGDEVIIPTYTFVSTANAFVLRGARPVFIDARPDTLNMDEAQLERLISKRTKAVVPVHYAGVGCEMDTILKIAGEHGIPVVEDNAHGLFGRYRGRYLGTMGQLGAQSFHGTKNLSCGEGGALLINEPQYSERAMMLRDKGTNRIKFLKGQVAAYTWVDVGSSYLASDILAAVLYAQLENRDRIQNRRKEIWNFYAENLRDWAEESGIRLPSVPEECEQSFHMFYLVLPSHEFREGLIRHLKSQGITSAFHYPPLNVSEMGQRLGGRPGDCPVAEDLSRRTLRLPFYYDLQQEDQVRIISEIIKFSRVTAG